MTKVLKSYQFLFALDGQQLNITVLDDLTDSLTSKYKWNNRDILHVIFIFFYVSLLLVLKYYIPSKIVYLFRKQTAYATKSKECKFNSKREELYWVLRTVSEISLFLYAFQVENIVKRHIKEAWHIQFFPYLFDRWSVS